MDAIHRAYSSADVTSRALRVIHDMLRVGHRENCPVRAILGALRTADAAIVDLILDHCFAAACRAAAVQVGFVFVAEVAERR
jgi:hypothetical protein